MGVARNSDEQRTILQSVQHLLQLINDILDISAIEAGKLEISEEDVVISPLIQDAIRLVQVRVDAGKLKIMSEIDSGLSAVRGNERRLKQILLNLMSNAIKFTPEGGQVSLQSGLDEDKNIRFVLTDTGIGMSEAEIEKALEPFGQVVSSLARRYEGTGLGLPLAKQLVEAHEGRLKIISEKGKETAVTVTLPADRIV